MECGKDVLGTDGLPTGERETTQKYSDATRYAADKSSLPDVVGGLTNFLNIKCGFKCFIEL
jgi:hypothetical protein